MGEIQGQAKAKEEGEGREGGAALPPLAPRTPRVSRASRLSHACHPVSHDPCVASRVAPRRGGTWEEGTVAQ